jgi:hypothetical protein
VLTHTTLGGNPKHKHTDTAYAFATNSLPNLQPDHNESTDFLWVTIDYLDKLTDDEIVPNVREIAHYVLADCAKRWEKIDLHVFKTE